MPEAARMIRAPAAKDVATFTLKVDGQPLSGTVHIAGVTVDQAVGRIPVARIEIYDGDPATEDFAVSSGDRFVPGKELEVLAGYRSQESSIFKGIIVSQRLRVRTPGPNVLTVHARHPLFKAALNRRSRTFADLSDADALQQIFSDYGILLDAAAGGPVHERLVQWQCTDWDFARFRAEANGLLLIPTDAGAQLAAPAAPGEPALSLLFGATVLELDAEMDARLQPTEATGRAWDPSAQEAITTTGAEPDLPAAGNLDASALSGAHGQPDHVAHPAALPPEELDVFVRARLLRHRMARLSGRVRCPGTPDALPGAWLALGGLGARFNGTHFISAVRHTLKRGGWQTDVQFGLGAKPRWEAEEPETGQPPAAGMLPGVHGLAIGVVTAIQTDPASEARVQLTVPALGDAAEPLWARLATFDAGDGRGAFFYPEVGDEVVVGFLADDPRHPVVLGCLHSSGKPPPLNPADDNPEKGYFSREGLKLRFNDETRSIILETPNGNVLELSDERGGITLADEHGNKIVLNSEGITIESATALRLKAATETTLEAGTNLELTASAQLTASASAGAELSASGNVVIKGAIVQIN